MVAGEFQRLPLCEQVAEYRVPDTLVDDVCAIGLLAGELDRLLQLLDAVEEFVHAPRGQGAGELDGGPVPDGDVLVVHLDLGRVLLGGLGLDVVPGTFFVRRVRTGSVFQASVDGSCTQDSEASRTGSFRTKVLRSVSCFSRNSRYETGTWATSTRPSTDTSALAVQLAQSLVAVTSNSRVRVAAVSRSTSSACTWTRVDSGGSCSPSSSFG